MTVNAGRTAFLPADRGGRQHLKIMQLLAAVEADGSAPLVETLIATVGRLRRGMTAVVITPSLDPSWVRPLAACGRAASPASWSPSTPRPTTALARGGRAAAERRDAVESTPRPTSCAAKRARALRHALAEYELPSYAVTPGPTARRDPGPMNAPRSRSRPAEGWLTLGLVAAAVPDAGLVDRRRRAGSSGDGDAHRLPGRRWRIGGVLVGLHRRRRSAGAAG